jgi:hypothetical protein
MRESPDIRPQIVVESGGPWAMDAGLFSEGESTTSPFHRKQPRLRVHHLTKTIMRRFVTVTQALTIASTKISKIFPDFSYPPSARKLNPKDGRDVITGLIVGAV